MPSLLLLGGGAGMWGIWDGARGFGMGRGLVLV